MGQGKLKVVKQEMAWMNIDILGIRELKWTRIVEFNSDDHYMGRVWPLQPSVGHMAGEPVQRAP